MDEPLVPESWRALHHELEAGPSTVLAVGASDSGKSTFCRWLAAERAAMGEAAWLIDADIGQSQIGPPAAIGCARVGGGAAEPMASFFVGDVSPRRAAAAVLGAMAQALRAASDAGAGSIVIDTTGWVSEPDAVSLKVAKAAIAGAAHIVLVEREGELRAFRRAWRNAGRFAVHTLQPAPEVRQRSPAERRTHREASFRRHLEGAIECELDMRQVAASGAGSLQLPRPSVPSGLLLGLNDGDGRLLSIGILQSLDSARGMLTCWCRLEGARAAEVRFGRLFIELDGTHSTERENGELA